MARKIETAPRTDIQTAYASVDARIKAMSRQLSAIHKQKAELAAQEREISTEIALLKVRAIQDQYQDKANSYSVTLAYSADSLVPALVNKVTVKNLNSAEEAQAVAKKIQALKLGSVATTGSVILNGRKKVMVFATETFKGCFPSFKKNRNWYWVSEAIAAEAL
jgi:hypothetical protein